MSEKHTHDIKKHLKVYLFVFVALLIGTVVTVLASYIPKSAIPFGVAGAIALALIIAIAKAGLVAGFFMHLVSEKKIIFVVLIFTVFFFAGLMGLTIWAMHDFPKYTTAP